jgi:hypothetical protein
VAVVADMADEAHHTADVEAVVSVEATAHHEEAATVAETVDEEALDTALTRNIYPGMSWTTRLRSDFITI